MAQMKIIKILSCCIFMLLLAGTFAPAVFANSAEPPGLTVIVSFPPEDLALSLRFADGSVSNAVSLQKEQKMWETYYRFFYGMAAAPKRPSFQGAALVVRSSEKSFECPLPESVLNAYNNLITLDFTNESIITGQSLPRSFLLIAMRVVLTLLIEGFVFFIFGYRSKASWTVFIVTNLITQGVLNIALSGPHSDSYWFFGFVFYEILIFAVETAVLGAKLNEHRSGKGNGRAVAYALTANTSSLILGGLLISYLPV